MGSNNNLKSFFCALLFLSLLLVSFLPPSSSSSHEIQPKALSNVPAKYRMFYLENTETFFLNKQELSNKKRSNKKKMRRKKIKNSGTGPFFAMLPKGFVPPSGSSRCHNDYPESETLYCTLSNTKPWESKLHRTQMKMGLSQGLCSIMHFLYIFLGVFVTVFVSFL